MTTEQILEELHRSKYAYSGIDAQLQQGMFEVARLQDTRVFGNIDALMSQN